MNSPAFPTVEVSTVCTKYKCPTCGDTLQAVALSPASAPEALSDEEPSPGQIEEWKAKTADYDRLAELARDRRIALEDAQRLINIALGLMDAPKGANLVVEVAKLAALAAPSTPASPCKQCDASIILSVSPYLVVNGSNEAMDELSRQLRAPSTPAAGEAWIEDEDLEAVIACLGDDAATLHNVNPEDEVADNMLRAVVMLERLRTPAATQAQASDPVRSALAELVSVKDLKERLTKLHEMGHGTDYDDYHRRHPLAWEAARAALAAPSTPAAAPVVAVHINRGVTTLYIDGQFSARWERELSTAEVKPLIENPWHMFKSASTQAQASDHTEQALGMVLSDAEIEKEAGNRVGNIAYKVGFIEGANFALGRTP